MTDPTSIGVTSIFFFTQKLIVRNSVVNGIYLGRFLGPCSFKIKCSMMDGVVGGEELVMEVPIN